MASLTDADRARFHAQVERGDSCWLWSGETNNRGYGHFNLYRRGKRVRLLAHRVAFELATGIAPASYVVRHDCDTPPCCNPAHLRLGTQAQNMQDCVERGRADHNGLAIGHQLLQDSLRRKLELQEKLCPGCATVKPFADFSRARSQADGLQGWCKDCCREANRRTSRKRGAA
jgi:hypothetical protein